LWTGETLTSSRWTSSRIPGISPYFFFSSRRRHTRWPRDWSSDMCSSDLAAGARQRPSASAAAAAADRDVGEERDRLAVGGVDVRSEERRVGKECRCRGGAYQ